MIEHKAWPKTTRLCSRVIATEKLNGSNCALAIAEYAAPVDSQALAWSYIQDRWYGIGAQSRNRLITPADDHQGFAAWTLHNATRLIKLLGAGHHYGEWLNGTLYLFNVKRWANVVEDAKRLGLDTINHVPVLYEGTYYEGLAETLCEQLRKQGSAVDVRPAEGIVIYWPHDDTMKKYFARRKND